MEDVVAQEEEVQSHGKAGAKGPKVLTFRGSGVSAQRRGRWMNSLLASS